MSMVTTDGGNGGRDEDRRVLFELHSSMACFVLGPYLSFDGNSSGTPTQLIQFANWMGTNLKSTMRELLCSS